MNPIRIPALLLSLVTVWTSAHSLGAPDARELDARLDRLVERLDAERERAHVPGLAIAVIKDGEVVLARGLGFADLEKEVPVTADTIFAAGSTTKAFTAALIAMLVDADEMDFDDPITDYLPWFQLSIDTSLKRAKATVSDLLSHRTGFTRMGMLWAGPNVTREEILRTATKAEPWERYRKGFHYNNVMYLAAGEAAGAAAGSDWDTLMRERLLEPLGMEHANTSVAEAKKSPHLALGYVWNPELERYDRRPMIDLTRIGPAGALNTNIRDMAQWVRFQLGRGELDGRRLVSEENLLETWEPNARVAPDIRYGMGWFVREYEGERLLEHGGNIDGFAAQVAFLPDENVGFALLCNVSMTPLQQGSIAIVFDALLGDLEDESAGEPVAVDASALDLEPYVGRYETNMDEFAGEAFEVAIRDGRLTVDVPGQTTYELLPPDDEGKWYFALTNTIAIGFERDEDGAVVALHLYQHGLKVEMPREGVELPADVDLDDAQRFLGVYRDDALGDDTTVVLSRGRLALDVPGQMVYEMLPPDEAGKRFFRVSDQFALLFDETDDGTITGFTFFERGTERHCPRIGDPPPGTVPPTVDEVLALRKSDRRAAVLGGAGTTRITGTVRLAQAGVEGRFVTTLDGRERFRTDLDFGRFGFSRMAATPDEGWSHNSLQGVEPVQGERLAQLRLEHPATLQGDWRSVFDRVEVTGTGELDGRATILVTLRKGELPPYRLQVDAETGDLLRSEAVNIQIAGVRIPMETTFSDFRELDGVRVPFRTVTSNEHTGRTLLQIESIEEGVPVDSALFATPVTSEDE